MGYRFCLPDAKDSVRIILSSRRLSHRTVLCDVLADGTSLGEPLIRYTLKTLVVLSLALGVGLIAFWFRSYDSADRLHGRARDRQSFIIASKQGRVTFLWFTSHGHPNWWQWERRTYAVKDEMSFPVGSVRQYERACGFGLIHRPLFFVMPSTYKTPDGTTVQIWGAATATLRGSGVIVPYWFLVVVACVASVLFTLRRPWQFSVRSLLVVVTLVAVVLGLVATLDR